jgi:hypothetical protein
MAVLEEGKGWERLNPWGLSDNPVFPLPEPSKCPVLLATDPAGNVHMYVNPDTRSAVPEVTIQKLDADGKASGAWDWAGDRTDALAVMGFNRQGDLYMVRENGTVAALDSTGKEFRPPWPGTRPPQLSAHPMPSGAPLAMDCDGGFYVTAVSPVPGAVVDFNEIRYFEPREHRQKVAVNADYGRSLLHPSLLCLTPDQTQLVALDADNPRLFAYHVQPDGTLANGAPFFAAQLAPGSSASGITSLSFDTQGNLYATSPIGIQVFDQAGRVFGIIDNPTRQTPSSMVFAGPDRKFLYVASGMSLYRRPMKVKGVLSFEMPIATPKPRL